MMITWKINNISPVSAHTHTHTHTGQYSLLVKTQQHAGVSVSDWLRGAE